MAKREAKKRSTTQLQLQQLELRKMKVQKEKKEKKELLLQMLLFSCSERIFSLEVLFEECE